MGGPFFGFWILWLKKWNSLRQFCFHTKVGPDFVVVVSKSFILILSEWELQTNGWLGSAGICSHLFSYYRSVRCTIFRYKEVLKCISWILMDYENVPMLINQKLESLSSNFEHCLEKIYLTKCLYLQNNIVQYKCFMWNILHCRHQRTRVQALRPSLLPREHPPRSPKEIA